MTGQPKSELVVYIRKVQGSGKQTRTLTFQRVDGLETAEVIGHGFAFDGNSCARRVESEWAIQDVLYEAQVALLAWLGDRFEVRFE